MSEPWREDIIKTSEIVDNYIGEMMLDLGYMIYENILREREEISMYDISCTYCKDKHIFSGHVFDTIYVKREDDGKKKRFPKKDKEGNPVKEEDELIPMNACVKKKFKCSCEGALNNKRIFGYKSIALYFTNFEKKTQYEFLCPQCRETFYLQTINNVRLVFGKLVCFKCEEHHRKFKLGEKLIVYAANMRIPKDDEARKRLKMINNKVDRELHPEKYPADKWAELHDRIKAEADKKAAV